MLPGGVRSAKKYEVVVWGERECRGQTAPRLPWASLRSKVMNSVIRMGRFSPATSSYPSVGGAGKELMVTRVATCRVSPRRGAVGVSERPFITKDLRT